LPSFALNKPAKQSSTFGDANAGLAVDGDIDGDFSRGSVSSTNFSHYSVFVSNDPFVSTDPSLVRIQPGVDEFFQTAPAGRPTTIAVGRRARYIRIQLGGANYLQLAEVVIR
jgi:hypothetical protein